jgi:hypothetical protein
MTDSANLGVATTFLVEAYAAAMTTNQVETCRDAAADISAEGTPVRYVRSIFVTDEETSFHVFEAASAAAVHEAARRAGLTDARISRAIETEGGPRTAEESARPAGRGRSQTEGGF